MFACSNRPSLYLSLLLLLSQHPSVLTFITGTPSECRSAPFVPGHNLAGEGFNVVTLLRQGAFVINMTTYLKRDGGCKLHHNLHQGNSVQKIPLSVVDWRIRNNYKTNLRGSRHNYMSDVLHKYTKQDISDWKVGLDTGRFGGLDVGGTLSSAYNFVSSRTKEDRYFFSYHSVTCTHYSYRVSPKARLSSAFRHDLLTLPNSYTSATKASYRRLITTYGTHYIEKVELGGLYQRISAVRTCLSNLNGFSSKRAHHCLSVGISLGLGKITPSFAVNSCYKMLANQDTSTSFSSVLYDHHTAVSGGKDWLGEFALTRQDSLGFQNWLKTLKDLPDVVQYSLRPLYELVPQTSQKSGLRDAIHDYLKENGIKHSNSAPSCGWSYRNLDNCCPRAAKRGALEVGILRAWDLKGDHFDETEGFVKMWYNQHFRKTHWIHSDNPDWDSYYDLGKVDTDEYLWIEVWDKDVWHDDLLGSCSRPLSQGTHTFVCPIQQGGVRIEYTLTCDPHLTGSICQYYKPVP